MAGSGEWTILLVMNLLRITLIWLALTAVGCAFSGEDDSPPTVTVTSPLPTPADTPALESTPDTPAPIGPVSQAITLTLWTSPEIAPRSEIPGGPTLLEQLSAFDNSHPDVNLFVELKTTADQGGTLSYLRTGRSVAPDILPDVILLPTTQLADAAAQELIYPLDSLLEQEAVDDLFPVAQQLVRIEDQTYGYPFALNGLQHLVYDSSTITETVPTSWPEMVTSQTGTFLFPAAGSIGAELTLQFYLAHGGELFDETGQLALQPEPLTVALDEIRRGVAEGFIDPQSGSTATMEQAWQIFGNNAALMLQTTSGHYLAQQAAGARESYRAVPLPGPNGPLTPTVSASTWAVSTANPARQALAAELIRWLASGQNSGEWTRERHVLPARRAAFDVWPDDEYVQFLRTQLEVAEPAPRSVNNTVLTALSDATTAVILGLNTPQEAATQAANEVQP